MARMAVLWGSNLRRVRWSRMYSRGFRRSPPVVRRQWFLWLNLFLRGPPLLPPGRAAYRPAAPSGTTPRQQVLRLLLRVVGFVRVWVAWLSLVLRKVIPAIRTIRLCERLMRLVRARSLLKVRLA